MEWKDSDKMDDKEKAPEEGYFDEEQYSPWAGQEDQQKLTKITKMPVLFILLVLAIVALVATLLMLVLDGNDGAVDQQKIAVLEGRIKQLEERLDRYEAMDEKVALIWEQAKSFEKFKDRFDRTEASMSLRMDHLAMSLESMQKQPGTAKSAKSAPKSDKKIAATSAQTPQYHKVQKGETLYSISKRYGLKVDTLRKMNKMGPGSVLAVGQKLIVSTSPK